MAATEAPTAANAADLDEKSKRVRSLLSSYYGTPQAPGSAPSTPTSTGMLPTNSTTLQSAHAHVSDAQSP